jgi:hypothetical protein
MKILFANIPIAVGPDFGGFAAVKGFKPKGKGNSQKAGWMRAPYDTIFTRANRVITLSGTVEPPPLPTLEEALLAMENLYGSLPDQGDLVKMVGASLVTYPNAHLDSFDSVDDVNGEAYAFKLTFSAGKPTSYDPETESSDVITDPGGAAITDPSGQPITDPPS